MALKVDWLLRNTINAIGYRLHSQLTSTYYLNHRLTFYNGGPYKLPK